MVKVVVLLNIILSLWLLYVARKIWNIKQSLARIADKFHNYEQASYAVLHSAPNYIYLSQERVKSLHENQQNLTKQFQQLKQIFSLIVLARKVWQRSLFSPTSIR